MIGTSRSVWGFDPRSVPDCQLWLDGADPAGTGTLPANGATVSTWVDKSGNSNNATGGTSPTYSTSGKGLVFSTASTTYLQTPITAVPTAETVFCVFTPTNAQLLLNNDMFSSSATNGLGFQIAGNGTSFALKYDIWGITGYAFTSYTIFPGTISLGSGTFSSSTATTFLNGGASVGGPTSTASPSGSGTRRVGSGAGGDYFNGTIHELIYYNSLISTSQRQQIEGYLAHKWGLTGYYDSSIPLTIPGCQLWLDGADQSSMTLSGSNVTVWNDKSGNGYHMNTLSASALWTGSAVYPTIGTSMNGLQTVNFVAQSGLKQATTLDGIKNLFWVGRIAAPTGSPSGPGAPVYFLLGHDTLYDWHATSYGGKFIETAFAQAGISSATASLFTSDPNAVTNATFSTVNMPSAPNISLLSVSGITGSTRYQGICYDRGFHTGWCGDLAEVITFTTALTTTQRQTIEGYLSKKWGIGSSSSIPSTHPFSSIRPHLRTFQPIDVPGCQLWLDGADSSTITFSSGSNVNQWNDKSGNGRNATVYNGTPTYTVSSGMTFNGSSTLQVTYPASPAVETLFMIIKFNSVSGQSSIFAGTAGGQREYLLYSPYSPGTMYLGRYGGAPSGSINGGTVTTGTTYMLEYIFNGTSNTISFYQSGTVTSSGTPQFTYGAGGTITLIGSYGGGGFLQGQIYEILVYNTALTASQRQQVEGYLARKWGISISATLPSTHPFKSFPPAVISETFTNTFTYTGGDQSFVVPTNVTSIKVYMWAGGGQGTTTINGSFYGGAGAYVQGVLTVTPGETLTIYVGQGGITGPTFSYKNGGYNSAGDAGTGTAGGRSGIARSSTNIVAVGAGGGGGGNGNGGAGGITSGSAGGGTNPGGGGTQSAGGSAGSSGYNSGGVGQNFGGGTGPSAYGGSGGDGFYGGGGGAAFGSGQLGGGGGGGSSLTSNLTSLVTFVSSNGYSAPNTNSRYYRSTIAAGGYGLSGTAGNGLVIITSSI